MLLACDIGNTRTKSVLFDKSGSSNFNSSTALNEIIDNYRNKNISAVAFSSVVTRKSEEFIKLIKKKLKISPYQITSSSKFNLRIDYLQPETLGIDRICSAEGAYYLFNQSKEFKDYSKNDFIISIDFGTATTLNFVKFPGVFIGGIISPGIEMMTEALNSQTAELPKVSNLSYKKMIGRNTFEAISSGVVNSTVGLLERSINELKIKYKARKIHIYVTGGNSPAITPHLKIRHKLVNELVLIGVRAVYEKNIKSKL